MFCLDLFFISIEYVNLLLLILTCTKGERYIMNPILLKDLSEAYVGKEIRFKSFVSYTEKGDSGNPYLNVVFNDKTGKAMINLFSNTKNAKISKSILQSNKDSLLDVRAVVKQVDVSKDVKVCFLEEITYISELVNYQGETYDMEAVRKYLNAQYKALNPTYKDIVKEILKNNPNFWSAPFEPNGYFSFNGGLSCYTAKVLKLIEKESDCIFMGNKDLLKVLAFSHEIGRTKTFCGPKENVGTSQSKDMLRELLGASNIINEKQSGKTISGYLTEASIYTLCLVYTALEATKTPEDIKAVIIHCISSKLNEPNKPKVYEARILERLSTAILEENEYRNQLSLHQDDKCEKGILIKDRNGNELYLPIKQEN